MIFGVALSQFVLNVWQTDPKDDSRTLIDYDLALFFLPMALQV
jgi:hypothetical protein